MSNEDFRQRINGAHLQPPSFSIVLWHLLHSFVLLLIQLAVSESSRHFCVQSFETLQINGRWSSSIGHAKQNLCFSSPQFTIGMIVVSANFEAAAGHETVWVHSGYGQNLSLRLQETKWRASSSLNR